MISPGETEPGRLLAPLVTAVRSGEPVVPCWLTVTARPAIEIVAVLEVPVSGATRRLAVDAPVLTMGPDRVIQSGNPETAHKHDELGWTVAVTVPPEVGAAKARELTE